MCARAGEPSADNVICRPRPPPPLPEINRICAMAPQTFCGRLLHAEPQRCRVIRLFAVGVVAYVTALLVVAASAAAAVQRVFVLDAVNAAASARAPNLCDRFA